MSNKIYLITYDLKQLGRNYADLYTAIRGIAGDTNCYHPLESVWLVSVPEQTFVNDIYNKIKPYIDKNDNVFVVEITDRSYQGWLQKNFWDWLKTKQN